VLGLGFAATSASAATIGGPAGTACTVTDFNAGLLRGDVTLTVGDDTYIPTACHGVYDQNAPNGDAEEQSLLNTNYGTFDTFLKSDGGGADSGSLGGLDVEISYGDGTWLIEVDGITDPVALDIGLLFKQGQGTGTWFLNDVVFTDEDNDGTGTFIIRWCTNAGSVVVCAEPVTDLSHLLVGLRTGDTPEPPEETPEPGSLLLLGMGMAGLALMQRRRRRV
jgi:hypothetical protein